VLPPGGHGRTRVLVAFPRRDAPVRARGRRVRDSARLLDLDEEASASLPDAGKTRAGSLRL
jgi:hypothetical protein